MYRFVHRYEKLLDYKALYETTMNNNCMYIFIVAIKQLYLAIYIFFALINGVKIKETPYQLLNLKHINFNVF